MMGVEASRSLSAGTGFNLPHAAALKRRGGERWGKGGARRRHVALEKMSVSEPLMTYRNGLRTLSKRVGASSTRRSMDDTCLRSMRQPVYRWHESETGFDAERGNLAWGDKGNPRVARTARENTNTHDRGGAVRSSDETTVMVAERMDCVTQSDQRRQLSSPGGAS